MQLRKRRGKGRRRRRKGSGSVILRQLKIENRRRKESRTRRKNWPRSDRNLEVFLQRLVVFSFVQGDPEFARRISISNNFRYSANFFRSSLHSTEDNQRFFSYQIKNISLQYEGINNNNIMKQFLKCFFIVSHKKPETCWLSLSAKNDW